MMVSPGAIKKLTQDVSTNAGNIASNTQAIGTLNSNLTPFTTAKSYSDGIKPTLTNGSHYGQGCWYFKVGCFLFLYISVEFSSAPTNSILFTLPVGYRPAQTTEITVSGGNTYNAKAQCAINASGVVSVTSVDKYVIGGGMLLISG